jgi:hypothetical protein
VRATVVAMRRNLAPADVQGGSSDPPYCTLSCVSS